MNGSGTPSGWSVASGAALMMISLAVVGTWPLCALVLTAYRRSVARGMRRRTAPPPPSGPPTPARPTGRPIGIVEVAPGGSPPTVGLIQRTARRTRLVFVVAGLFYAAGTTVIFTSYENLDWRPVRSIALTLLFGWPLLPTLLALAAPTRQQRWLAWLGWVLGITALLVIAGGLNAGEALLLIALVVGLPGLFVWSTSARALRGAAWLAAPSLALLALDLWLVYPAVLMFLWGEPTSLWAWSRIAVCIGILALLPGYAWLMTRLYHAKWASDETLLLIQWWLVGAIWLALDIGTNGWSAALVGLAPFALFLLILLGAAFLARPVRRPPVRLLLLRTFGSRRRSTRLLRDVTRQWRWIGSVELISAPDVATEILEPDEFLDFLRGELKHRFVADAASVAERLCHLDLGPDRDGRYRINEFLCHDDTWRPTVEGLIGAVDVVLLDLRGFTASNAGVVEELERLTAMVSLHRVVALVDGSTDLPALSAALQRAAALAPPWSPLAADPQPVLRTVTHPDRPGGSRQLLDVMVTAAAHR